MTKMIEQYVAEHHAAMESMLFGALESIAKIEGDAMDHLSDGGDNPEESKVGKLVSDTLSAYAVAQEQFDKKRNTYIPGEKKSAHLNFILTGSAVYGPMGPDSDLDVVLNKEDAVKMLDFLHEHGIHIYKSPGQWDYGIWGGFYFDLAGIEINIIIADDEDDFNRWRARTEYMKTIPPVEDKLTRHRIFNTVQATQYQPEASKQICLSCLTVFNNPDDRYCAECRHQDIPF